MRPQARPRAQPSTRLYRARSRDRGLSRDLQRKLVSQHTVRLRMHEQGKCIPCAPSTSAMSCCIHSAKMRGHASPCSTDIFASHLSFHQPKSFLCDADRPSPRRAIRSSTSARRFRKAGSHTARRFVIGLRLQLLRLRFLGSRRNMLSGKR